MISTLVVAASILAGVAIFVTLGFVVLSLAKGRRSGDRFEIPKAIRVFHCIGFMIVACAVAAIFVVGYLNR